jgi:hypothetical protein
MPSVDLVALIQAFNGALCDMGNSHTFQARGSGLALHVRMPQILARVSGITQLLGECDAYPPRPKTLKTAALLERA